MGLANKLSEGITQTLNAHETRFLEAYKTYSSDWFKKIKELKETLAKQKRQKLYWYGSELQKKNQVIQLKDYFQI